MEENHSTVRLFLGCGVESTWPDEFPKGKIIDPIHRHATLAFLGNIENARLEELISLLFAPEFTNSPIGRFTQCTFFPKRHPRVAAWKFQLDQNHQTLVDYQKKLTDKLVQHDFIDHQPRNEWIPHVTLCRHPKSAKEWLEAFQPLPFYLSHISLYESLGNSQYRQLWSHAFIPPFEELDHTADEGFRVFGRSMTELYLNAACSLSFIDPSFLIKNEPPSNMKTIDECISQLNQLIFEVDSTVGSQLKAVSYHGDPIVNEKGMLEWEMIIDV